MFSNVGFLSSLGFGLVLLGPGFGVLLGWGFLAGFWSCGWVKILAKGFNVGAGLVDLVFRFRFALGGYSCGIWLVTVLAGGLTVGKGGFLGWVVGFLAVNAFSCFGLG